MTAVAQSLEGIRASIASFRDTADMRFKKFAEGNLAAQQTANGLTNQFAGLDIAAAVSGFAGLSLTENTAYSTSIPKTPKPKEIVVG